MSHREQQILFSNQRMVDVTNSLRERILREVKDSLGYRIRGGEINVSRDELVKKFKIPVAKITGKDVRVVEDWVECVVKFEGANGSYFHYAPSKNLQTDRPKGYSISDCVLMYFPKTDDAASLKTDINEQYENLLAWYNELTEEVNSYNKELPAIVDDVVSKLEKQINNDKALEDELNS